MVHPGAECGESSQPILVILSAEQFCVAHCKGDKKLKPDASGRCSISWNKYPDMGKAFLGYILICGPLVPFSGDYETDSCLLQNYVL